MISNGTCSVISNAIDLVIDPNPVGSDDNTSVDCTGELNYNLQANVDNAMEANTVLSTFTWTVSSNPNVSGASAGSGSTISQTLINTSTTAQVVTYTVTPTSVTGGCAGATFTVTVTVPACADVSVVKAVSNASPNVGEEVTFTIAVSNAGPSPAASVTVSDALPTGYTLGTINDGGTETGGTITWSVGTLSAGSTATVSFTATVDEEGSYANTAVASSPTSDPDPDNNESTVTPEPIASPSLLLEKVGTLESDGTIAYTFTVTNTGNVTISGIAVSDDKIAAAIELGATELAPGASTTGTAVYTPTEDELVAGQVVNQATVTGEDPDGGSVGPVDSDDPTTPEVGDPTIVATGVLAVDDEGSANGHTGGTAVSNILDNDRLSGAPATTDNVDVSFVSSTHSGITLEGTSVVVALGTPAGTYELVYEIADLANPSNRQQATVTVIVTTDELEAVDDQGSVGGQAGGTAVTNVLANDIYNGGAPGSATTDNVSIEQVSSSHSGITLNGTDVVVAPGTPAGEYELVYRITDLLDPSKTSEATVRVTVWDGPVANDDAVTVPNDGTTSIDVLGNDEEGSSPIVPGSVTIVTGPEHGTATVNADGTVTYTPNEGYTGDDSFTYTVSDENGLTSNEATVNITVEASVPEVPPVANNDAGTVTENGTIAIDVLGNDEEGSSPIVPGSVTIVTGPEHGTVTVNADGTVTYTPNEGYSGNDSFTYTVSDENGLTSNEATVNITVEATLPPVANNDTGTVTENGTVAIDVLGNDEAGSTGLDPGSVTIVVEPEHGTVTVNADGTVTYTPNEGYTGDDSFTYTVAGEDGKVSNEATVGITVRPTVPVANDDSATTEFNTPVTVNVLANDEADVSPLDPGSVTITFGPSHGTVVVNADGTVTYTPEPGYTGSDSFGYTVRDANGNVSNEATVRVEVTGFFIPNVFTPNGDGINDRFQIVGREQFDRIELNVFNRWGGEVYSNENYRDEWDGNNLNEGTYYYLIKTHREGRTEVHKGWVLLKRR
ncbi:Ig-like domain-containing protein [Olivibacter sitiensis]|uniref:Ig-like domain-containing protein n=1 Tax=Olivibacter sitiensis TaxID=376470 RepID=UPI002480418E|nr:Ig-like domain-containing protein [Olivibacter sitiensis]